MTHYGNYFGYQQPYYQGYQSQIATPVQQQPATQNSGILWVQGENGAKSFLVAPGQSVMLMDSEATKFYIKSADNSGMPMPLRVFDYIERKEAISKPQETEKAALNAEDYITRAEFEKRLSEFAKPEGEKANAEPTV